ncbi:uncharacterized protein LOC18021408 isoform X2 [Eutrema salsugineum]|uniref:uncharacterized protein LOC18021408 isoform X2 n=1 Tax=Eutrema salsugineum TaxID=72664 RepID=UPI000CED1E3A|nr:uncharacterized protein LOC18021408 isoform X2 [Eutrema salsugineum]
MSKPILLVFLLIILIVTSQFEWRQPLVELDAATSLSQKQQQISDREEAVKEKINLYFISWWVGSHCNLQNLDVLEEPEVWPFFVFLTQAGLLYRVRSQ